MLNLACVKFGKKYGADYVNILRDMTLRNLPEGTVGRFVCFTDDATGLDPSIHVEPLPGHLEGWWNKLWLFHPSAFPQGERVLYFDLDTAITGPLDAIADYVGPFAILRDFYRPDGLQSAVMAWEAGSLDFIYREYEKAGFPVLPGGDQEWIERCMLNQKPDLWQALLPGEFVSYREHARLGIPKGAKVVNFHGDPKPHQCEDWVPHVWKVGGGTSAEFIVQCNTPSEQLASNIRHAKARKAARWLHVKEQHDGVALICAGGPSLADSLASIGAHAYAGAKLFAVNGSLDYLRGHGVEPDAHVLLDARPQNSDFIRLEAPAERIYSSQCDPSVQSYADVLFHPYFDGIVDITGNDDDSAYIGGGTTAGLKAIVIAYVLGFRVIHLYGFDSSYRDDANHAYAQALNDSERLLEAPFGGVTYRCAPWMVTQAEDFRGLMPVLIANGCEIHVHGDGLIPAIASSMQPEAIEGRFKKAAGMWWPKDDWECRASVINDLPDLAEIIALCKGRSVAVQAGGNVGSWPLELSRHFKSVVTFEPDADNFECLTRNTSSANNITAFNAGLSDVEGKIGLSRKADNCGAHFASKGDECEVMPLDCLNLKDCDLLQLDVEGCEPKALAGALATIERFRPLIVTEEKGLHTRYGGATVESVLAPLGYRAVRKIHNDVIYAYQGS